MIIKDKEKLQKIEAIYLRRQLIINDLSRLQTMLASADKELEEEIKRLGGDPRHVRPQFEGYKLVSLEIEGGKESHVSDAS